MEKYIQDGYVIFPSGLSDEFLSQAVIDGGSLWSSKPADLLGSAVSQNGGRPLPMSLFPEVTVGPGFRILDGHSHSERFEAMTALPKLHRLIELILGERAVATQSLYFPYGSTQTLHRDPWYVVTTPIATLVAAWIALEDISPASGPLTFVPGSHRLPYKPLSTGDIVFHEPSATAESKAAHVQAMKADMAAQGLQVKEFLAKKGDILVWHGSLVHGGSRVTDPTVTRQSYVVHFDAARVHPRHAQSIRVGDRAPRVVETRQVSERDGCLFFPNPCAGRRLDEIVGSPITPV